MLHFPFSVLCLLFVSFRPSLLRSHSRSASAYMVTIQNAIATLAFSPSGPRSFVRFPIRFRLLSLRSSFPFYPFQPHGCRQGAFLSVFPSACFHASVSTSVLSLAAIPFSTSCFASQQLTNGSSIILSESGIIPLANALGSGYSAGMYPEN